MPKTGGVFNGLALAILQAGKTPGPVTVTARADGLRDAAVQLDVEAGTAIPALP